MQNKSVLGLLALGLSLLVWACGSGAIDPLEDSEILMMNRFPDKLKDDFLDSVVNACQNDEACWDAALASGKIYKGDYTQRANPDDTSFDDDDDFIWSSGSKLPRFSSSGAKQGEDDGEEDPIDYSSSSKKRSSSSGEDDDYDFLDGNDSESSSSKTSKSSSSISHNRSCSSKQTLSSAVIETEKSSSSVNHGAISSSIYHERSSSSLTVFSSVAEYSSSSISSSSKPKSSSSSSRVYSSSSKVVLSSAVISSSSKPKSSSSKTSSSSRVFSSSSKTVIEMSSIASSSSNASSSSKKSSSSVAQSSSSKTPISPTGSTCSHGSLKGTCQVYNKSHTPISIAVKNQEVVYEFTPAGDNACNATDNISWIDGGIGAQTEIKTGGYEFNQSYSIAGEKTETIFWMGGERIQCPSVIIKSDCHTPNSYSCTRTLISDSDNLWKNNPVKYKWNLKQLSGCFEITNIAWQGDLSGNSTQEVTKDYTSTINASVSVSVTDESGTTTNINCQNAFARYVEELPPVCNVSDKLFPINESVVITPNSLQGCDYTNEGCSYSIKKNSTNVATGSSYKGGALNSFAGEASEGSVNYTLTLTNHRGSGSCNFNVEYAQVTEVTATTSFISYAAGGLYRVSVGTVGGGIPQTFKCKANAYQKNVGEINGVVLVVNDPWSSTGFSTSSNRSYLFSVYDDIPNDMTCGLSW